MKAFLLSKWGAVILTAAAVLVAIVFEFSPASFKDDLLTSVIPNLLASIFAIAAIMERAAAVLNDIWFGEERDGQEERFASLARCSGRPGPSWKKR
jgi:4-hydroxybenzoate polyprenyltransferase